MYVLGGGTSKPAPTTQAVILPGQTATGLANALSSGAGYKFGILMRLGARSDTIKALQEKLRAEGFFTYPTSTGFFGSVTLTAVKAYQKAHGLVADGIAGPKTIAELNK
jgi:peptidoglycan hydrolase-like protein with peptidoglycan-binding domain